MSTFELWSNDLFDREAEPTLDGRFPTLNAALRELWRRVLEEGIQDNGTPTFTAF